MPSIYVKEIDFTEIEKEARKILADIDNGKFDQQLDENNLSRPVDARISDEVHFEMPQALTTDQWYQIIVTYGPLVVTVGTSVWEIIVVPRLKRLFPSDSVSSDHPDSQK